MWDKIKQVNWRKVLYVCTWAVCLIAFFILMGFINAKKNKAVCQHVDIIVPGAQAFVSQEDVLKIVNGLNGPLIGHVVKDLPVHDIEKKLSENPFIKQVSVYAEMDGQVHVKIEQREAVMRIINQVGSDFYIDQEGVKFPTSPLYAPHVIVANGNIAEQFSGKQDTMRSAQLKDLYQVAQFLQRDSLWNSQIEQLYVNKDSDIMLVPRVGNQTIILGNGDSLQTKFDKLLIFYKQIIPQVGWGRYKTVNLKFANQLVCEKADSIVRKENSNKQHINTH